MEWRITLGEPDIGDEEIEAVTKVLRSRWLTMGAVTEEFERAFAEKMQVKHAIAVSNATVGLHLANVALGIGPGDEVLCPALTFVASANASRYTGADVDFVDSISENDLTMDPRDVEAQISSRTKAITVVHYAGFPCLMDEIMDIAHRHGLKVIEDSSHAPFGWYRFRDGQRRFTGAIGDVGCFSFFGNKNLTTGEGGMVTTNDDRLAAQLRLLRSHGMTSLTYERHKGHASGYDVLLLGYNYRMDEMRSAIGLCQLRKIDRINEKRRAIYRWYCEALSGYSNVVIPFQDRPLEQSTCHIMPVLVEEGYDRVRKGLRDAGVQTSKHYDLIPHFSYYDRPSFQSKVRLIDRILTLPMHGSLTRDDVSFVADTIRRYEPSYAGE